MASLAVKTGKSAPKSAPTPPARTSMMLGSRPAGFRTPGVPRIKPLLGQTQYGKVDTNVSGNTGMTSRS